MPSIFTPATLRFLRALKRNNDRDWFKAHRDEYERSVRAPMVALIERLAEELQRFAPDLVASPRESLYRIYRDTRFSADKSPLKTYVSAVFPSRGLSKKNGAGLYVEVTPSHVWAGGGIYRPQSRELLRIREHIAAHLDRFRAIVDSPRLARRTGGVSGERLQRVPRGFSVDHPAAEYLKLKQFLAGREYPAAFATSPRFLPALLGVFEAVAPLVTFLNEPLLTPPRAPLGLDLLTPMPPSTTRRKVRGSR
ncbi:MAG: TIGR02453 family protein [Luteitalea sp.]|nr:TIGR02453 family protein [Luteitalea sp.]